MKIKVILKILINLHKKKYLINWYRKYNIDVNNNLFFHGAS